MGLDANCDNGEQIGLEKQQNLDNVVVSEAKIKRTDQEKTLKVPKRSLKTGQGKKTIEGSLLFVLKILQIFNIISTMRKTIPKSLFKDNFMTKPNKVISINYLLRIFTTSKTSQQNDPKLYVVLRWALLHTVTRKFIEVFQ